MVRLFHFSEDPGIALFTPRTVRIPVARPAGQGWLNGPLAWAIDDAHDFLYLFPRECPRILIWPTARTSVEDREQWFGHTPRRAIAFIEEGWLERLRTTTVHRYDLPTATFEDLGDVGMRVSRAPVKPLGAEAVADLPQALEARNVELRVAPTLTPLRKIWATSLHASGLRLRNAQGWGDPRWPHSPPQAGSPAGRPRSRE
ncbi:MAG: hypothetical protein JWO83_4278 [Caulobacteraceae bacterium]|nr:hypothetical protein [Caulobacteraceae bacterium]